MCGRGGWGGGEEGRRGGWWVGGCGRAGGRAGGRVAQGAQRARLGGRLPIVHLLRPLGLSLSKIGIVGEACRARISLRLVPLPQLGEHGNGTVGAARLGVEPRGLCELALVREHVGSEELIVVTRCLARGLDCTYKVEEPQVPRTHEGLPRALQLEGAQRLAAQMLPLGGRRVEARDARCAGVVAVLEELVQRGGLAK